MRGWTRSLGLLALVVAALALVAVGCGGNDSSSSGGGGGGTAKEAGGATASTTKCGKKPGTKATGTPIKVGAIVTKQPGTDFTDGANMAQAYFNCVNDNGGINGHPIVYKFYEEQTNPAQIAGFAHKLIQTDKVVAVVGGFSIIECAVDHKYWESLGIMEIDAGIAPECYGTPNSAAPNMGPRYSSDGAVQAVVRAGAKKIAFDQSNVPGTGYIAAGPTAVAKSLNVPITQFKDNVPIQDANSVALKLVQAAGSDGAVVLNFTPPEALKILQAAQQQGLQDRVKWACSTPCNTDFLANALGAQWNGKLGVNAELALVDSTEPDNTLYQQITKQYAPSIPLGSFGQMGFVSAAVITRTLLDLPPDQLTQQGVNAAIRNIKSFKTDILCQPWYFGDLQFHVPNNVDRTVVPNNRAMVQKEDCFQIAALPGNNLEQIRAAEAAQGLNK